MRFGATKETTRVVDILEDLGAAVKLKREHLGATLRDVSTATGLQASTIYRVEQGRDVSLSGAVSLLRWLFAPDGGPAA